MPLIVVPKNYKPLTEKILDTFGAKPISEDIRKNIYHSGFRDNLFEAVINDVPTFIFFTGYERSVSLALICEYDNFLRQYDSLEKVIYLGCCFATAQSNAEPGDIVIPISASSDSDFYKRLCEASIINNPTINEPNRFDPELSNRLLTNAIKRGITPHQSKIFSIIPFVPQKYEKKAIELIDDAWWWPFAEHSGNKDDFKFGEYEAAFVVATSNLIRVPSAGILYVREKRNSQGIYYEGSEEKLIDTTCTILDTIKDTLIEIIEDRDVSIKLRNYEEIHSQTDVLSNKI